MKTCLLLLFFTLCYVQATHFIVGNPSVGELDHKEEITYNAIPFMKRVKQYFFAHKDNKKIVGIQALDNLHSQASINITAGGVGHSFVNLRLKSERGSGLDYSVGIYVEPLGFSRVMLT